MLDPSPFLRIIRGIGFIGRNTDRLVLNIFRQDEVQDDGQECRN